MNRERERISITTQPKPRVMSGGTSAFTFNPSCLLCAYCNGYFVLGHHAESAHQMVAHVYLRCSPFTISSRNILTGRLGPGWGVVVEWAVN